MVAAHDSSRATVWRAPSLRARITLLATTVVVLLLITLSSLFWILRSTQASAVSRSEKHLTVVARALAKAYASRSDSSISLAAVPVPPRPPSNIPPPAPPHDGPPPPPPPVPPSAEEAALEQLTAKTLQSETGIEGGFFRASDRRLLGYSFPTHEGPGDPGAMPARETPNIARLARIAATERQVETDQFYGAHDVVLFVAVPLCDTNPCQGDAVGSAWLMQRLPGAEADRKRALLWSAFGFGATACITVLFAFFVLRQVGQGTSAVLDRLTWMETDLAQLPHPASVQLAEYHHVLDGLDRLGNTLRAQIERERELQVRLRQHERLAAIGQLAAGVAHELRNPLATIRLRAQMAQRKTQEEATAVSTSIVLAEVDRLDAMIERLLDFSRPIRVDASLIDLSALVQAAADRWQARRPGIRMQFVGPSGVSVLADALRLEQVLDNLTENAVHQLVEASTPEPRIELTCGRDDQRSFLTIADNGGGFTEAALHRATEPFFTTRAAGTGLGLAITHEIVNAMGGTLILSNTDTGALVRIQFAESDEI